MAKKNRIQDLNDHLFTALEGLNDDDLTGDKLDDALRRAQGVAGIADRILRVAEVRLSATKVIADNGGMAQNMLQGLTYES